MKTKNKPEFISMSELIEETGFSEYRINEMIKGGLPWYRNGNGNRKKFKKTEFDQWVEENNRVVESSAKSDLKSLLSEVLAEITI